MVTVFTPTYNRAYILPKLYESLRKQTSLDFEWLIVDDGSTDDTGRLCCQWAEEAVFPVRYVRQPNGGKHRAINRGVQEAVGELFFIVDSDDQLSEDAVEAIQRHFQAIRDDSSFAGVCGLKAYFDGAKVGGECNFGTLECNALDFRYKHGIKGDMAEVFRTEVLREYPFPEIGGERFCPEALVWNRIAGKYKLRYFYEKIYLCDYLQDGLTAKITRIRMQSPVASCMCYAELLQMSVPLRQKVKAAINYWRFWFCRSAQSKPRIGIAWMCFMPIGLLFHLRDVLRVK